MGACFETRVVQLQECRPVWGGACAASPKGPQQIHHIVYAIGMMAAA